MNKPDHWKPAGPRDKHYKASHYKNSHSRDAPQERLLCQNEFGKHPKYKYLNRVYSSIKSLKLSPGKHTNCGRQNNAS